MFRKLEEFVGLKAEAKKRGLGRSFELCRLQKGKEGSEAFSRDWNILR